VENSPQLEQSIPGPSRRVLQGRSVASGRDTAAAISGPTGPPALARRLGRPIHPGCGPEPGVCRQRLGRRLLGAHLRRRCWKHDAPLCCPDIHLQASRSIAAVRHRLRDRAAHGGRAKSASCDYRAGPAGALILPNPKPRRGDFGAVTGRARQPCWRKNHPELPW